MSLLEELNNDIKQAMKDKNKDVLSVIRMVKSTV
ncbi:MAG: GatB/YqeY domain-containing protein, partial [Leuconostoc mesenteroides]